MPRNNIGSASILTATINPAEVREVGERLADSGMHLIDTPVSGCYPGAQGGTLTLMLSTEKDGGFSYEGVYHHGDGDFERGFRSNIGIFKDLFG